MKYVFESLFKVPVCDLNWAILFEDWDLMNWRNIFNMSVQSSLPTKLRYFQYKIIHRYLAVNKLLTQMGIIDYNVQGVPNFRLISEFKISSGKLMSTKFQTLCRKPRSIRVIM